MAYFKTKSFLLIFTSLFISLSLFSQTTTPNSAQQTDSSKPRNNIFLNYIKFDTISVTQMPELLNDLSQINFKSATIYFTGNGFPSTATSSFVGSVTIQGAPFTVFFNRCVPGSRIILERCVIKNTNGSITRSYNKSIYIK